MKTVATPARHARPIAAAHQLRIGLLLLAVAACDSGSTTEPKEPEPPATPRVETITVSSAESRDSMRAGQRLQLTAAGRDQNGQAIALTQVAWSSSAPAVATVDPATGLITARANGQAVIRAASGGKEGTFNLTVWCKLHPAGGITASETWTAAEDPHCVTGMIQVEGAGVTLTIEAGSEVYFARDANLWMGAGAGGRLRAVGTASAPIRMLADTTSPVPGFWDGIALNDAATGSELAFVTMSHCGGPNFAPPACLTFTGTQPVVRNVTISNSAGHGIHAESGGAFAPGSADLTITGSARTPLYIEANHVGSIPASATFSGNGRNAIEVQGGVNDGAVQRSQTWRNYQVPYVIRGGQLFVAGTHAVPAILTIEPGTELRFEEEATMIVGTVSGGGALVAQGTQAAPIRFTAETTSPAPVHWRGIDMFEPPASAGNLTHVVFEFCGAGSATAACIEASDGARPVLRNVTVRNSAGYGIHMRTEAAFGDGSADVVVSGTTRYPVRIAANSTGTLPTGSFSGGPASAIEVDIFFDNSVVTKTQTWPNRGVPYVLTGLQLFVQGDTGPVLTLEPGTELRFGPDANMIVGNDVYGSGALVARGTASAPIRFTTSVAPATPGSWDAMSFYAGAAGSVLDHVIVEYAGAGMPSFDGNIHVYADLGAFISNSIIRNSQTCGIFVEQGVTTNFTAGLGNTFTGNGSHAQCSPPTGLQARSPRPGAAR